MNASAEKDLTITTFDAENWWGYMMCNYPRNYACACQYYTDIDEDLASIGHTPGEFDVNDYFTICQLPRISAVNGIIKVDGKIMKRYGGYREWKIKRIQFEKLKKTNLFEKWKNAQFVCQNRKCAWCRKPISLYYKNRAQVDHVVPLYYDGTNELSNLVLTCWECNNHKGIKTEGYNSRMNFRARNEVPRWINNNYYNNFKIPNIKVEKCEIEDFDRRKKSKIHHIDKDNNVTDYDQYDNTYDSNLSLSQIPF